MSNDFETDLRREFDAVYAPSGLTFSPESVLRQGKRTILRRRIIAAGSAAMAVAVVATGASLFARPDDKALPLPASTSATTATTATTGIVRSQFGFIDGTFEIEFDRDTRVEPNVHYFFITKGGRRQEIGNSSTGKPGQKPDAVWRSGIVEGRPVTMGLVPGINPGITFTDGANYGSTYEELKDIGYTWFAVKYPAKARPTDIASIRWSGPNGVVDGIEGGHRVTGRILTIDKTLSVEVALNPGDRGRIKVLGRAFVHSAAAGTSGDLNAATTDASGVAVVTGRDSIVRKDAKGQDVFIEGPPIAAGILPPGASKIGVELTSHDAAIGLAKTELLPDGRVIFAIRADWGQSSDPRKDSIKAVTWTNDDGSPGRKDVTQKQS